MDCIIPGANIKILSRIISVLSKIGDDIYFEAKQDSLCLKSVNMTTTVYCTVSLYDIFFTTYEVTASENDEPLLCRLPTKGVLGVFKSHGHKDKKPDFCKIELEQNASKIVFRFRYKHDVTVVRSLYLNDGHIVNVVYNKDAAVSHIGGSAQIFSQVLANFQAHDEDMSIEVNPQKALIRNYIAGDSSVTKNIRSQITLNGSEFSSYKIDIDGNITFSLKPFRAAVHLAELYTLGILIHFEKPGRPVLLEIKNPTFDINFVMATLKNDDGIQSSLSSSTHLTTTKTALPQNQGLDNINWDDFNEPMETIQVEEAGSKGDDVVPSPPESLRNKKVKSIFSRCYDETFRRDEFHLGKVLALDSDPDSD